MVSIVIKYQRCGKKTCKCMKEGKLHGPYFWAVTYKGSQRGRMKYKWIYLGKAIEKTLEKLNRLFPEMKREITPEQLQSRLNNLVERTGKIKRSTELSLTEPRVSLPLNSSKAQKGHT